tara:strand:- start:675 stop:1727 length:1053 start_codon:yes stop_codon:yes gene_type:complete
MIDYLKTFNLVKNGLLSPKKTWASYLDENHSFKDTAINLTGPLIFVSVILSAILGWVFSSHYLFARQTGFVATLLGLIAAVISIFIVSFVFSYLAGVFNGKHNFDKGFAALSLAVIPAYFGSILSTLPLLGGGIGLVLSIISLVFLYQIIPTYLEVPDDKRVLHYIASLFASAVLVFIVNMVLGIGTYSMGNYDTDYQQDERVNSGVFGEVEHQAKLMNQAENDRYERPKNGLVTDKQMEVLIDNLKKVSAYRLRQEEKLERLEMEMKDKKDFSFSDFGKLTSGMNSVMSTANAEMEVVKTSGGNWAEHQWIKEQLRTAAIQKDLNSTVKHNYALYNKYEEILNEYGLSY